MINKKDNELVRYQWLDENGNPGQFLELRINIEPITNDLALIISDSCIEEEVDEQKSLWDQSVNNLIKRIGGQ